MRLRHIFANLILVLLIIIGINLISQGSQSLKNGQAYLRSQIAAALSRNLFIAPTSASSGSQASQAINKVLPSVVSIYGVSVTQPDASDQSFNFPMLRAPLAVPRRFTSVSKVTAGSGFFVSQDGYILTNRHVVSDTSASYSVQLSDGTKLDAAVIYRDPDRDLAIIKISGNNYPALPLGDSSQLKIGQTILSVGNAYGQFSNTVSEGAISALNKTISAEDEGRAQQLSGVIQTSAQLYPGDSGGPTFDLNGDAVGINVATALNHNNISFSIPINDAKAIIKNVIRGGE